MYIYLNYAPKLLCKTTNRKNLFKSQSKNAVFALKEDEKYRKLLENSTELLPFCTAKAA